MVLSTNNTIDDCKHSLVKIYYCFILHCFSNRINIPYWNRWKCICHFNLIQVVLTRIIFFILKIINSVLLLISSISHVYLWIETLHQLIYHLYSILFLCHILVYYYDRQIFYIKQKIVIDCFGRFLICYFVLFIIFCSLLI